MISEILKKAKESREKYVASNNLEAYRLYDRESDKLTEVAVEVYANNILVLVYAKLPEEKLKNVISSLEMMFPKFSLSVKDRTKEGNLDLNNFPSEVSPNELVITEFNSRFKINLTDRLDTGLYLDAREIRRMVKKMARKKRVLNLFSYTASIGVTALAGGAKYCVNVDISKTYNDWARENHMLNELQEDRFKIIQGDVVSFLKSEKGRPDKYDLIIVDPPTYSHGKAGDFNLEKDHVRMINDCLFCLSEWGKIIFTHHSKTFRIKKNVIGGRIEEITNKTMSKDFVKNPHRSFIITNSRKYAGLKY